MDEAAPTTSSPVVTGQPEIPDEPRLLTICLPEEPSSLFIYGDLSRAARSVRQAINDGPIDINNYETVPIILENMPTIENGGVFFEPITVQPGELLVDSNGVSVNLSEGTNYLPAGCPDFSCAQSYSGQTPIQVDQQVVRFTLKSGINWQDGEPIRPIDSQFSFEIAKSLYPKARAEIIERTYSYMAIDDRNVEWRGIPGFRQSDYNAAFFTPLPEHAWNSLSAEEMLAADASSRKPIGWGAYMVEEWTPGDHISLIRNPAYFRQNENLPNFDQLVFRFVSDTGEALQALRDGDCDYLDEGYDLEKFLAEIGNNLASENITVSEQPGVGWEKIEFGINSLSEIVPPILQSREVRQAVAYCSDRQKIVDQLFQGKINVSDSYVSPAHPLANPDVRQYSFNPAEGARLLDSVGWLDLDGNPITPRTAQGVNNIPDGAILELEMVLADSTQNRLISSILRESTSQCGIGLNLKFLPPDQLFTAGDGSPIFGRNFMMAQYGWAGTWQPPCFIFSSQEIPGPYPQYPKGWGGSNPSGYSSIDFDRACKRALTTMPQQPGYQSAHFLAQAIFAEDLPALPLFHYSERVLHRSDLCSADLDPSAESSLWNIESYSIGTDCK